jgi:hypothetical protein
VEVAYTESAPQIDHDDRYGEFFAADHPALFHLTCRNCSFYSYIPVGTRLLDDPAAVGYLSMSGIDVTTDYLWELPFITDAKLTTVQSQDPWEVIVHAPTQSGSLAVRLDDEASIQSITLS